MLRAQSDVFDGRREEGFSVWWKLFDPDFGEKSKSFCVIVSPNKILELQDDHGETPWMLRAEHSSQDKCLRMAEGSVTCPASSLTEYVPPFLRSKPITCVFGVFPWSSFPLIISSVLLFLFNIFSLALLSLHWSIFIPGVDKTKKAGPIPLIYVKKDNTEALRKIGRMPPDCVLWDGKRAHF